MHNFGRVIIAILEMNNCGARVGKGVAVWHSCILVMGGQIDIILGSQLGDLLSKILEMCRPFDLDLPLEIIWHVLKLGKGMLTENIKK